VEGICEHGNELSGFIKCWEFLEYLHNWRLLKKGSAPWVSDAFRETNVARKCEIKRISLGATWESKWSSGYWRVRGSSWTRSRMISLCPPWDFHRLGLWHGSIQGFVLPEFLTNQYPGVHMLHHLAWICSSFSRVSWKNSYSFLWIYSITFLSTWKHLIAKRKFPPHYTDLRHSYMLAASYIRAFLNLSKQKFL
jgi:hypothetical protein